MAYKNENQYTTLIHEGENVTINPPGVINAEGDGGGVEPVTPFEIKHDGETMASVSNDGDLTLEGTVYINGDTDVQELNPIFDIDITGDYENNTFTSSQTFAEITEALETGHTLIARDTNGFVYTQVASEFDPENDDSITFATVQTGGIYYLTWTGASRTISYKAADENVHFVDVTGMTQQEVWEIVENDTAARKVTVLVHNGIIYTKISETSTRLIYNANAWNTAGSLNAYTLNINHDAASAVSPTSGEIYKNPASVGTTSPVVFRAGDTYAYFSVSDTNTAYRISNLYYRKFRLLSSSIGADKYPYKQMVYYIENNNYHLLELTKVSGLDNNNPSTNAPITYTFSAVEPYSANNIKIYECTITFDGTGTTFPTVTTNEHTYTIGS